MGIVFSNNYKPLTDQELADIINAKKILNRKLVILQHAKNQTVNIGNLVTLYQNLLCLRNNITDETGLFSDPNKKFDFNDKKKIDDTKKCVLQDLKGIAKEVNEQFVFSLPLKYKKSGTDAVYFTVFMSQYTVKFGLGSTPNSIMDGLGISHVANQISDCNAYEVLSSELGIKYKGAFDEVSARYTELFDKTKEALLSYAKEYYNKQIEETEKEIDEWR